MGGGSSVSNLLKKAVTPLGLLGDILGGDKGKSSPQIIQSQPAAAQGGPKAERPTSQAAKAPKPSDAAVQAAKKKQSRIAAAAGGRARNILTSGRGLETEARTTKKTLLGQ